MAYQGSPLEGLVEKIEANGGWVNAHAHFDRAYTVGPESWHLTAARLEEKWDYVDMMKRGATVAEIQDRMRRVIENQLAQGAHYLCSFIDCDSVVRDKALIAADNVRAEYAGDMTLVYANQPLKGLVDPVEYDWFKHAAEFVDIIGGLPERDERDDPIVGGGERHVDKLIGLALEHDKPLHIHADQMNDPNQRDTEMILRKVRESKLGAQTTLIHCLSLAAQPKEYREMIYRMMVEDDVSIITCPTAWIDSRRNETLAVTHSASTPVDEMVAAGVTVALGTDNIQDVYKPFSDGNLEVELRTLLEVNHLYDINALAQIASVNGLRALHLPAVSHRLHSVA